jgi:hypothetical protein
MTAGKARWMTASKASLHFVPRAGCLRHVKRLDEKNGCRFGEEIKDSNNREKIV